MTTNHPEKLDEALIRPGRVDHQVAFGNATQTQIKELFERMYTNDLPRTKLIISSPTSLSSSTLLSSKSSEPTPPSTPLTSQPPLNGAPVTSNGVAKASVKEKKKEEAIGEKELSEIAENFAREVPNDQFSPAEVQGFLLKRKTDPRKALAEVRVWVEGMVEQKKKGTKLVNVQ